MTADGGRKRSEKWLGILLGAAFIAAAAALFLMSDAGRAAVRAERETAEQTEAPCGDDGAGTDAPDEKTFVETALDGLDGAFRNESRDEKSAVYSIVREGFEQSGIILSLEDGRVEAFTLLWSCVSIPDNVAQGSSEVARSYEAMLAAEREEDKAWLRCAFHALTAAMDTEGSLSYAEADMLADDILLTLEDGKERNSSVEGYAFNVKMLDGETKIYFMRTNATNDDN